MSLPVERRRKADAGRGATSKQVQALFAFESQSLFRQYRRKQWKSLRDGVFISLVLHVVLLSSLSVIVFTLPEHAALDLILSMVIGPTEPMAEHVLIIEPSEAVAPAQRTAGMIAADDLNLKPQEKFIDDATVSNGEPIFYRVGGKLVVGQRSKVISLRRGSGHGEQDDGLDAVGPASNHLTGRSDVSRPGLVNRMGGNADSEAAVGRGLVWLKNHQLKNGSWTFSRAPGCTCSMFGQIRDGQTGATALALMAFLGAGKTHLAGEYQEEVRRGLEYLTSHGGQVNGGIRFSSSYDSGKDCYSHGLATIALSEAFAMTHDPELRPKVVGAVRFLMHVQKSDGGWRYDDNPAAPSDLSVVGFQLMGLKSAQFSRIPVPQQVFLNVESFLDSVSVIESPQYSYTDDQRTFKGSKSMTAVGLLCRMYLDTGEANERLRDGITFLSQAGPDPNDMYFNFYATQVLHHWGGPEWDGWNIAMRDRLIETQKRKGHAEGSWDVADPMGTYGGRLYMTTLALLTLEVYYRHLPLYQRNRVEVPLLNGTAARTKD